MFFFFFFLNFLSGPRSILWSHWLLLFWTSCVLPHGFQIQSRYLACTLSCLHAVILKVTSGVTPAFSTNRGVHCISVYMAWRPVTFPTCHVCNRVYQLMFGKVSFLLRKTSGGNIANSAKKTPLDYGWNWLTPTEELLFCGWSRFILHSSHENDL